MRMILEKVLGTYGFWKGLLIFEKSILDFGKPSLRIIDFGNRFCVKEILINHKGYDLKIL